MIHELLSARDLNFFRRYKNCGLCYCVHVFPPLILRLDYSKLKVVPYSEVFPNDDLQTMTSQTIREKKRMFILTSCRVPQRWIGTPLASSCDWCNVKKWGKSDRFRWTKKYVDPQLQGKYILSTIVHLASGNRVVDVISIASSLVPARPTDIRCRLLRSHAVQFMNITSQLL